MRLFPYALIAAALAVSSTAASASQPSTTRIETRPFYGATVTLEEGVRVFRPLPSHNKIIINPGGKTPLNLSYEENHTTSKNYNYNYNQETSSSDNSSHSGSPVGSVGSVDGGGREWGGMRGPRRGGRGHGGHGGGKPH